MWGILFFTPFIGACFIWLYAFKRKKYSVRLFALLNFACLALTTLVLWFSTSTETWLIPLGFGGACVTTLSILSTCPMLEKMNIPW